MVIKGKPLEWIAQTIHTTDDTVTNARLALGLKDDEVAEIHKIYSELAPAGFAAGGVDITEFFSLALSMDPDVIADPAINVNQEDLEWFYTHNFNQQIELTTEGAYYAKLNDEKTVNFDPPVLVGTDVGIVVGGDTKTCDFLVRLYFTRRRALVMELNQVLLKRR